MYLEAPLGMKIECPVFLEILLSHKKFQFFNFSQFGANALMPTDSNMFMDDFWRLNFNLIHPKIPQKDPTTKTPQDLLKPLDN